MPRKNHGAGSCNEECLLELPGDSLSFHDAMNTFLMRAKMAQDGDLQPAAMPLRQL